MAWLWVVLCQNKHAAAGQIAGGNRTNVSPKSYLVLQLLDGLLHPGHLSAGPVQLGLQAHLGLLLLLQHLLSSCQLVLDPGQLLLHVRPGGALLGHLSIRAAQALLQGSLVSLLLLQHALSGQDDALRGLQLHSTS